MSSGNVECSLRYEVRKQIWGYYFFKKIFFPNSFPGHVECSYDKPAENFIRFPAEKFGFLK